MAYKNKEDARRHYKENKAKYLASARVSGAKAKRAVQALILTYLLANPCMTCGEADPVVLEFDHRDPAQKEFSIAEASRKTSSIERIEAEIAKCDVLCANCHRRKTYVQFGWKTKT